MEIENFARSKYKLISLASGSSGNCYYLGSSQYGILIDAGIGFRMIKKYLREYGIASETIIGVLVTHEHTDHIKTVGYMASKLHIPIYATRAVHEGIERCRYTEEKLLENKRIIEVEQTFEIKDFRITAFDVPHDSIENVGYTISFDDGRCITIATDVGHITDRISYYAGNSDLLIIEANYDSEMLKNGSYPQHLKARITSGNGHLSNQSSGEFVASVYNDRLKDVWLCHLSNDNNHPELAYKTVEQILSQNGIKVGKNIELRTLSRGKPSGLKEF